MKFLNLVCILMVAMSGLFALEKPAQSQDNPQSQSTKSITFQCRTINGVPTTVAETDRGTIPLIRWVSQYFSSSGYTPETRCQIVSQRFQILYEAEQLNYLTVGFMNGYPVACSSQSFDGICQNLVFTLERGEDLENLEEMNILKMARLPSLYETNDHFYIDMEQYLNKAPALPSP